MLAAMTEAVPDAASARIEVETAPPDRRQRRSCSRSSCPRPRASTTPSPTSTTASRSRCSHSRGRDRCSSGVVLSAWRWQRVLLLFDVEVRLTSLFSHYLVGLLVGNVLPSTIGGDVVRVARASNTVGSAEVSFGSVVLERLTGFVGLPLLVFAGFAIRPSLIHHAQAWIALFVAVLAVAMLALILFLAGHPRLAGRYAETRELGALHRRRAPRGRAPAARAAPHRVRSSSRPWCSSRRRC